MSDDWKIGYKRALLTAFARQAEVREPMARRSYYAIAEGLDSERTKELRTHLERCSIDPVKTPMPIDSRWDEFMGTFYEGDTTKYGVDATITCKCGAYRKVDMRLTGTFAELLDAVLRED